MTRSLDVTVFEKIWQEFANEKVVDDTQRWSYLLTPFWVKGSPTRCAQDKAGKRYFAIPAAGKDATEECTVLECIEIKFVKETDAGGKEYLLSISCDDPSAFSAFNYFLCEVIRCARRKPAALYNEVCLLAESWRLAFAKRNETSGSVQQRLGIFGELVTLRKILNVNPNAIYSWRGPDSYRHDFYSADVSLEIKASQSQNDWNVSINGLGQLERDDQKKMYLLVIKVIGSSNKLSPQYESIKDVVNDISNLAHEREEFFGRLRSLGVFIESINTFSDFFYRVTDERLFLIDEKFPKISRSMFSDPEVLRKIKGVSYIIDVKKLKEATNQEHLLINIAKFL